MISIDMLPDEVLLEIFVFYVDEDDYEYEDVKNEIEVWQRLVHVCRRWRRVVFGSTNRLKLQLLCTSKTPARDTLDVWPALPLIVLDDDFLSEGVDNIVAALECSDRVVEIRLERVGGFQMEKVLAAMQVPFPKLTRLELYSNGPVTVVPDSFLDGHAPVLDSLWSDRIPIPGLPSLLLHSTHLSELYLYGIPHSGYFSPKEIVTCLSSLTGLKAVGLGFESPLSRPDRVMPPRTRTFLPTLSWLKFDGVIEYVEDFVARIDAPQLNRLNITLFNQIDFDTRQLVHFVRRTAKLKALEDLKARLAFGAKAARVNVSSTSRVEQLDLNISCRELDWQVSSLEQPCASFIPSIFAPEDLYIYQVQDSKPDWKDNVDNLQWLVLLLPFAAVKNLHLCKEFTPRIAPVLEELIGARTTEVLPALQNIYLEELQQSGPVQGGIGTFVAARQLSGHPVTVSRWERDLGQEPYFDP
jgi:hypothetical protein